MSLEQNSLLAKAYDALVTIRAAIERGEALWTTEPLAKLDAAIEAIEDWHQERGQVVAQLQMDFAKIFPA